MIIEFIKTQPALFVILCIATNLLGSFNLYINLKKLNKNQAKPLDKELFHKIYLVGSIVTMIIFGFVVIENL